MLSLCRVARLGALAFLGLGLAGTASAGVYTIGGVDYGETSTTEFEDNVPFDVPNGWTTTNQYSGFVKIEVAGTGYSAGNQLNDAFYVFTNAAHQPIAPYKNPNYCYQLNIATMDIQPYPISGWDGWQAYRQIVYDIDANTPATPPYWPAYNPNHTYNFVVNVGATPAHLRLGVSDGQYNDNGGAFSIQVTQLSNQLPLITCNNPMLLWPPDHELIDVSSAFSVEAPDGLTVTWTVTVYCDESEIPETGDGTGKNAPDFKMDSRGVLLRAERSGNGDGRIYIGVITATLSNGVEVTERCVLGVVPHDDTPEALEAVLMEAADGLVNLPPFQHGLSDAMGPKQ